MTDNPRSDHEEHLTGTLHWNDLEGGFWTLEIPGENPPFNGVVTLHGTDAPSWAADEQRATVHGRARVGGVDFFMAGTPFDVTKWSQPA